MSDDINKTIEDAEKTLADLDTMMKSRIEDSEVGMKKAVVQTVILSLITVVIYFIWGTTWYFWMALVLSGVMIGVMAFGIVMINKAKKRMDS